MSGPHVLRGAVLEVLHSGHTRHRSTDSKRRRSEEMRHRGRTTQISLQISLVADRFYLFAI